MTVHSPIYLISGATSEIGLALAKQLDHQAAKLILMGRNEEKIKSIADNLNADYFVADACDSKAVENCFQQALEKYTNIDGVAHCVGSILLKPAHLITDAEWETTINVNLKSSFVLTRAITKHIQKNSSIVFVSSAAASTGIANHEAIAAAKAGVNGLTLSAAATYASRNMRFNVVAPGLVRTQLTAHLTNNPVSEKAAIANHPLHRLGEPKEVAALIAFLLNPENSWITGQVIGIDGGLSRLHSRASI
jgi:3-oxoacyl-[acyl-carrier protein] reductase